MINEEKKEASKMHLSHLTPKVLRLFLKKIVLEVWIRNFGKILMLNF